MAIGPSVPDSDPLPQPKPEEVQLYNALRDYMARTNDNLQFLVQLPVITVTTTYTATPGDYTILGDTTGGGFTITLPEVKPSIGRIFVIKSINATGTLTIQGNGSDNIDGANTATITVLYDSITVHSDGTSWHILNNKT